LVALEYNWFCLQNWFYLKLWFVAFDYRIDFYTQIYSSTHFYTNVSKHKSLHLQLAFRHNQFYRINSLKINFSNHRTKHTQRKWLIRISIENGINIRTHFSLFLKPVECFRDPNCFHGFDSSHRSVSLYRDYDRFSRRKAEPETGIGFVELQETRWLKCNGHKNFTILLKNTKILLLH